MGECGSHQPSCKERTVTRAARLLQHAAMHDYQGSLLALDHVENGGNYQDQG